MPYTADKPAPRESSDELRARIPGWGADLDPADRPSVPREKFDPEATGAHWTFPERQPETVPRERSSSTGSCRPSSGRSRRCTASPGSSGASRTGTAKPGRRTG
jgi:hypothetical protein